MKKSLCILFLLLATMLSAQDMSVTERNAAQGFNDTIDRLAEDFVEVGLIVAEPGEILYSAFGHAMLHLRCPSFNLDYVFSYESEPIKDNWGRFLRGDLKMGMFAIPIDTMLEPYLKEGRGVVEYPLHLSPTQEQDLWRIMDDLAAIGADQPYDYFNHGCAISVVHVVRKAIGQQKIQYGSWPDKFDGTMRELGYECVTQSGHIWNRFALMTLAGSDIDNPRIAKEKKLIIPTDLANVWQHATLNGKPLLGSESRVLVPSTIVVRRPWLTPLLVACLLLLLSFFSFAILWGRRKSWHVAGEVIDYLLLAIITFIGVVVMYTVLFSSLPCTDWNWLIIPFNILPAIGWYWRKYWALPYAGMIAVWCMAMLCAPHRLVDWSHIILALAFAVVLIKQYLICRKVSFFVPLRCKI